MTCDEYCDKRIREMEDFREMWKNGSKERPKYFPESMEEDDWHDQEMTWISYKE